MDADVRSQITYASYVMPANIAKEFINDANIGIFKSFEQKKEEAEKLKSEWEKEIETKKAEALKDKLVNIKLDSILLGYTRDFLNYLVKRKKNLFCLFYP